ncbi:MAG: aminotransferase class V-fold PLP-dependent enzyme [Planctomycetota bacterium]
MEEPAATVDPRFPVLRHRTFLNHAAVAPISGPAADVLARYAEHASRHAYLDWDWYGALQAVRESCARMIGAEGTEGIAFVPNTSTGLGMVAGGLDWRPGDHVVLTDVEYPANRYCWHDLKRRGVTVTEVPEGADRRIDVDEVVEAITDRTRVVAISHAQYSTGYRIDLKPIAETVHLAGGYLCVDAIQTVGAMPVDVVADGIDFLSADGHKWMLGPEGAGFFYCRPDLCEMLHPPVTGWIGMEDALAYHRFRFEFRKDARRFEPGTWNIPGLLALGASLEMLLGEGLDTVWARIEALTAQLRSGLRERGYRVVSPNRARERSGITSFLPPRVEPFGPGLSGVVKGLRERGIEIAQRAGLLRVSPHFYNTAEQVDGLLEELEAMGDTAGRERPG